MMILIVFNQSINQKTMMKSCFVIFWSNDKHDWWYDLMKKWYFNQSKWPSTKYHQGDDIMIQFLKGFFQQQQKKTKSFKFFFKESFPVKNEWMNDNDLKITVNEKRFLHCDLSLVYY